MKIARLFPKSKFKKFYPSDTLWGNIVFAYKMLYGEKEFKELLNRFISSEEKPFLVSSMFPFAIRKNGSEKFIYYFPKPIIEDSDITPQNPEDMVILKKFKKIKYLEKSIFEKILNGELSGADLFNRFKVMIEADEKLKKEKNEHKKSELKKLADNNDFNYLNGLTYNFNLHNSIDRMSTSTLQSDGRGQLYFEAELAIPEDFGLFFLYQESENIIEPTLRLLSDIGLGGNRSIGKGAFNVEFDNIEIVQPKESDSLVLLSLYQPTENEIKILTVKKSYYDLTNRIGAVGKDFGLQFQQKNPVTCFVEGSTFGISDNLIGKLIPTAKISEDTIIYSNYLFFGVKGKLRSIWKLN